MLALLSIANVCLCPIACGCVVATIAANFSRRALLVEVAHVNTSKHVTHVANCNDDHASTWPSQ